MRVHTWLDRGPFGILPRCVKPQKKDMLQFTRAETENYSSGLVRLFQLARNVQYTLATIDDKCS